MRHRVLIALLAFGTVAGYASGFASLRRARCHASSSSWRTVRAAPPQACAPCPGAEAPPPASSR
jgi:hypothetical protein